MRNFFLFQNVRKVMLVERYAVEANIRFKIMPVPSELSSECGMCIETAQTEVSAMNDLLTKKEIDYRYEQI